jgi:hypothetical protein
VSRNLTGCFLLVLLLASSLFVVVPLLSLLIALVIHFPVLQRCLNFFFPYFSLTSLFHQFLH